VKCFSKRLSVTSQYNSIFYDCIR